MRRALLGAIALASAFLIAPASRADEDDDEAPDDAAARMHRFEVPEDAFESWLFRRNMGEMAMRTQFECQLELAIDDVARSVKLSAAQREKMKLAGRMDIKRYFDDVEVLRRRFMELRKDREKFNQIWREMQPLQMRAAAGIFGNGSIFRKTLRRAIPGEQADLYERAERERRALRYRGEVEWVVAMVDNVIPLRDEQRQKLIRLLVDETRLPRVLTEYDHYVILWQLTRMPEDKLKPLFDEAQWKELVRQLERYRSVERFLKESGRLSFDGDPPPGEAEEKPQEAVKGE